MTVWLIRAHTSCDTLNIFFQISVKCGRVQVGILYHLPLSIVSISSVRSGRKKERTLLRQRRSLSPERIGSALRLLSLGTRSGVVIFSIRLLGTPAERVMTRLAPREDDDDDSAIRRKVSVGYGSGSGSGV